MDKYSRRVVGWSYDPRKDVLLALQALNTAVRRRRPSAALVFQTDRGIEYAAGAFKQRIAELASPEHESARQVTDNALIESFFHSMNSDVFHGHRFDDDGVSMKSGEDSLQILLVVRPLHSCEDAHYGDERHSDE